MRAWGRLPSEVVEDLRKREWDNSGRLIARLLGDRTFPIAQPLKPPTGSQALENIAHFHEYIGAWMTWPKAGQVIWESRKYQQLGEHRVPVSLKIDSIQALIEALGENAVARSHRWAARMSPLLEIEQKLFPCVVKQLSALELLSVTDVKLLAKTLTQLKSGMGKGLYLRALPLVGVDTKFVETHQTLLVALLDGLYGQEVSSAGGLESWLCCTPVPKNWLFVRPLCPATRSALAGLSLLRLSLEQLLEHPLPGKRILVVENYQSGFALPTLADTVAVFGGGLNTLWMQALWLKQKEIGYWGDIDTWGLKILAEVRQRQPHVQALMMDEAALEAHANRTVHEPSPVAAPLTGLTLEELGLFESLRSGARGFGRLEQERLSQDFIVSRLLAWIAGNPV